MSRLLKFFLIIIPFVILVLGFQNCGEPFKSSVLDGSSPSGTSPSENDPPVGNPPVIDPPVSPPLIQAPGNITPLFAASHLKWSFPATNAGFAQVTKNLGGACDTRLEAFLRDKAVTPVVFDEGLLPGDPLIAATALVKRTLARVLDIAFCAYYAPDAQGREQALMAVKDYIQEWEDTYVGDGNPINDRFFVDLFLAVDFLSPKLSREDHDAIKSIATIIDQKEIQFMAAFNSNDNRLKNNWFTRHLIIRYLANVTLRNTSNLNSLKAQFVSNIDQQYIAPSGFTPSTCANLQQISSYGSFDLQERDAFLYHSVGIHEVLPLILLEENFLPASSKQTLLNSLSILKPFVLNQATHPEFQCSEVPYDINKLALDPSLGNNWDPDSQARMFRYARLLWPEIKPWTSRYETNDHPAWFRILFNAFGDGVN